MLCLKVFSVKVSLMVYVLPVDYCPPDYLGLIRINNINIMGLVNLAAATQKAVEISCKACSYLLNGRGMQCTQ